MENTKKIDWYTLAFMAFSTVWGFGNVLNGFVYFNGVQVIFSWVLMFALYFVPYALMVGELGSAFKQSLRQGDACGNFVKLHLLHSQVAILIYIFYITCIPSLCLYSYSKEDNDSQKDQSIQFVLHFDSYVDYRTQKSEK